MKTSQITRNIKVIVNVRYIGERKHLNELVHYFNYDISIENRGEDAVQLLKRNWLIKDTLREDTVVDGEGVVGEMPVLRPNEFFQYTSGSYIYGGIGSMEGYYSFINTDTNEIFHVRIPLFNLIIPNIFN